MSVLDDYIRARESFIEIKLDLQVRLREAIKERNDGKDPEIIRDIVEWNGEIRVLVSDLGHKNTRQLVFSTEEIEQALRDSRQSYCH